MIQKRKHDARIWAGLLLLVVGLLLADRSFAIWRNDLRNFARADGSFYTAAEVAAIGLHHGALETRLEDHAILKTMAGAGLGLVLLSIFLLRDMGPASDQPAQTTDHLPGQRPVQPSL